MPSAREAIKTKSMAANRYTTFLTIAGTDPTGGAGVLADVKTATVMGLYAMAAVTAVTAQNTLGVRGFRAVPLDMLADQLDCIFTDIPPDAVKVGMLPTAAHVRLVAEKMRQYKVKRLVVDPVMVATSGDSLTDGEVTGAMLDELLPLATVITPNLPEAETLVGRKLEGIYEMEKGARELGRRTQCGAVLLKGGTWREIRWPMCW